LLSGATVTASHLYIKKGDKRESEFFMFMTVFLALFFISFQAFEYITAPFDISDGVYGSTFFLMYWVSWVPCYYWNNFFICYSFKNV